MQILLSLFAILHISSPRSLHKKHRPIHLENRPYYHTGLANLLSVAQDTRQGHKECVGCTRDPHLYLTKLGHHDAVCNDGSRAGYYLRKVNDKLMWVIYLQGGDYCNDVNDCEQRKRVDRDLTSSTFWPATKEGQGILSTNSKINPLGWGSNLVYVPYCTSDLWLGDSSAQDNEIEFKSEFHFRGARVISRVIDDLLESGMKHATHVLVTGTSAGGVGVMFHIDKIAGQLRNVGSNAEVRGISDSGWFIESGHIPPNGNLKHWKVNKTVGDECLESNKDNPWKCLYGNNIYPKIKTPLMIVQFYFDTFQLLLKGINLKEDTDTSDNLSQILNEVTSSLRNLDTVFGVSCFGHGILDDTWLFSELKVRGVSLKLAIECWYMGECPKRNMDVCDLLKPLLECNDSCPVRNPLIWNNWPISRSTKEHGYGTSWQPYGPYDYFKITDPPNS